MRSAPRRHVGVLVATLLISCSSTDWGGGFNDDAGSRARAPVDAGYNVDIDANVTGGSCPVPVTKLDIVDVNPPKPNTQGSCTDAEVARVTGTFSGILAAVSASCASCLFSESNDMTNSQFFIWTDNTHTSAIENFGACFGSDYAGGNAACGKAAEEDKSCLQAACPTDATGATMCTDITDAVCIAAAQAGECKTYNDAQTSACGGAAAFQAILGKCLDSKGGPNPGIKLLCGGGSSDAATEGSSDATTEGS